MYLGRKYNQLNKSVQLKTRDQKRIGWSIINIKGKTFIDILINKKAHNKCANKEKNHLL